MQGTVRQLIFGIPVIGILALAIANVASADDAIANDNPVTLDWTTHIQVLTTSNAETSRQFIQLKEALGVGALDEAETIAKQLAERAATNASTDTEARARTLHNLAMVQHLRADYAAAILNYKASIGVINSAQNMLSAELVPPLHALGIAYVGSGDPAAALDTFDTALHVSNVNDGPHSAVQLPVLLSVQSLHERQGDPGTASVVLDRIYQLYIRQSGPDSEALLPALRHQAEFYKRHEMYRQEYTAWYRSLLILRKHRGSDDLSLVEPQLNLGRNMIRGMHRVTYRSGPTAPSAEKYLRRAMNIATEHPDADWKIKRRAILALADYYMLAGATSQGHRYYREAWALMSDEDQHSQRFSDLEKNVPISRPHPDPYANFEYNPDAEMINPADYRSGMMVAEFRINKRGRTAAVEIVEQNPPDFERMEWRLRAALKDFVYRPRMVDGDVEPTHKYRYQLEYFYLPSEYEASLAKSGKLSRPRSPDSH